MTPEEFDAAWAAAEPVEIVLGPNFRVRVVEDLGPFTPQPQLTWASGTGQTFRFDGYLNGWPGGEWG